MPRPNKRRGVSSSRRQYNNTNNIPAVNSSASLNITIRNEDLINMAETLEFQKKYDTMRQYRNRLQVVIGFIKEFYPLHVDSQIRTLIAEEMIEMSSNHHIKYDTDLQYASLSLDLVYSFLS